MWRLEIWKRTAQEMIEQHGQEQVTLPTLIRTLDPLKCGIKRGPLYNLWAYHKYEDEKINVEQRYPDLKLEKKQLSKERRHSDEDTEVTVIDFWYISPEDGSVWNAI